MPARAPDSDDTLKRERAGTYRTRDGRFTIEGSSSGWLLLDAEQTDDLGLPLTRGPFATLDALKAAIGPARSGPAPTSDLGRRSTKPRVIAKRPAATGGRDDKQPAARAGQARKAPPPVRRDAVVIREIRIVDGDALRALWAGAGFTVLGDDDRSLARLARRNPGLVLVASAGGRVIGSALGAWDGRRGWIYHVAVAPSHRRQGIASRMVEQIEEGLAALGCPKVNVLVRDANEGGAEFWSSLGYAPGTAHHVGKELASG